MTAAPGRRARAESLLLAHCATLDPFEQRAPVAERLGQLIGPDLARLLLVALVGDHRMWSRDLAA